MKTNEEKYETDLERHRKSYLNKRGKEDEETKARDNLDKDRKRFIDDLTLREVLLYVLEKFDLKTKIITNL